MQMPKYVDWILRILAAVILLQTLFFKFTAAAESVYIFSALGMEPWGRIGIGIMELICSILILVPRTVGYGALLGVGLMAGAIYFHLSKLGIVVRDDGGQLFAYACITMVACIVLSFRYRRQLTSLLAKITSAQHMN